MPDFAACSRRATGAPVSVLGSCSLDIIAPLRREWGIGSGVGNGERRSDPCSLPLLPRDPLFPTPYSLLPQPSDAAYKPSGVHDPPGVELGLDAPHQPQLRTQWSPDVEAVAQLRRRFQHR